MTYLDISFFRCHLLLFINYLKAIKEIYDTNLIKQIEKNLMEFTIPDLEKVYNFTQMIKEIKQTKEL